MSSSRDLLRRCAVGLLLIVSVRAFAAAPPGIPIPSREVATNGAVYFQNRSIVPSTPSGSSDNTLPQSPSNVITFDAIGYQDALVGNCQDNTVPDTQGAVGTNYVVTMLNTHVRIQTKDGAEVQTHCAQHWWTNVAGGPLGSVADPRVLYDSFHHRWIASVFVDGDSTNSAVLLAISRTSDPTTQGTNGWHFIRVKADTNTPPSWWADQPTIGFNKHWIVVHAQMMTFQTWHFERSHFWVFDKTNVYAGGANHKFIAYPSATRGGAIIPAVTYDTNISTFYLLQNANGSNGFLRMFTITGSIGSEVLDSGTNVYATNQITWADVPPDQVFLSQAGTTDKIQILDSRLHNVVFRNGHLWTAHHIFLPATSANHVAVQWWQINPTNGMVVQNGHVEDATGRTNYAFPTIGVNKWNDLLIGYSSFSSNHFPSANYSFRAFYDPMNVLRPDRLLKAGEEYLQAARWGDYSATMVDPLNDLDLWTVQEYVTTNTYGLDHLKWQTRWAKVEVPIPTNDNFSAAITLAAGGGSITNVNYRAGKELGESNHAGNIGGASIWYSWTPTNSSQVAVDTLNSDFDTLLAVYTGSSLTNLSLIASDNNGGSNGTSRVIFSATSNTTYRIAVDGLNGYSGNVVLNWRATLPPVIIQQPQSTNVIDNANEDATFSVIATGSLPLSYQWLQEGTNIPGATASSITRTNVQAHHATNYTVVINNSHGSVTSAPAGLFVHPNSAARMTLWQINDTSFWFHVFGVTNRPYRVITSTNLGDSNSWYSIHTNWTSFWYTNFARTNDAKRFYRALTNN